MAEFNKNCDVFQGYNFKKDVQTPIGFVTKLTIGDADLKPDQTVKNPLSPDEDLKVVSVLSGAMWGLGPTDAVYLSGQISVTAKQQCVELIYRSLTKVEIVFQYTVFDYDPLVKKYFKCFHCGDTDLKGILEKNGDDLTLSVADVASREVQSPENYAFYIGIKPQPQSQSVTVAPADQKNVLKAWGISVAA
jgi:hypothetical protein